MSRTLTAMYDSRSEAEAAKRELEASGLSEGSIQIIDQGSGSGSTYADGGESRGFFGALKDMFMPDEDRHAYSEGLRRGHFLLSARVDDGDYDDAMRVLDSSSAVDFDTRQSEWRSSGWDSSPQLAEREESIPIAEERLAVGKREVERGGARVRSYVQETPVNEQVTLREEHVSVERRPVDERISSQDLERGNLLQEREVEMTERGEEAVVAKEARVREELVVRKTAEERTENIQETVRHTEVDVDEGRTGTRSEEGRGAFGFSDGTGNGTNDGDMRSAEERTRDGAMQSGR